MIWALIVVVTVVSMHVAGRMAQLRHRSVRRWLWAAARVGPLAPAVLYLLGSRGTATLNA